MAGRKRTVKKGGRLSSFSAGILAAILLGGVGVGIGIGNGLSNGNGTGTGNSGSSETENINSEAATDQMEGEHTSDTIIIEIDEYTVKVNGHVCNNEQELKEYIQQIYADGKVWILEDDHAILSTYEWVTKVCKELNINLKE